MLFLVTKNELLHNFIWLSESIPKENAQIKVVVLVTLSI